MIARIEGRVVIVRTYLRVNQFFLQMSSAKEEVESVVTIQQPGSWIEDKGSFNDLLKE